MHPHKPRQGNLVAGGGRAGHGPIGLSAASAAVVRARLGSAFSGRAPPGRRRAPRVSRNASLSDYRAVLATRPLGISAPAALATGVVGRARASPTRRATVKNDTTTHTTGYGYIRRVNSILLRRAAAVRPSRYKQRERERESEISKESERARSRAGSQSNRSVHSDQSDTFAFFFASLSVRRGEFLARRFDAGKEKNRVESRVDRFELRRAERSWFKTFISSCLAEDNGSVAWRGTMDNGRLDGLTGPASSCSSDGSPGSLLCRTYAR